MKHTMKLKSEEFYNVKNGLKHIEVRINDEKRKKIKRGDIIRFSNVDNMDEKVYVKVIDITRFNNFKEIYDYYPLEKFGTNICSKEELIKKIYKIYTREEENLGALAIEIGLYNKEEHYVER